MKKERERERGEKETCGATRRTQAEESSTVMIVFQLLFIPEFSKRINHFQETIKWSCRVVKTEEEKDL